MRLTALLLLASTAWAQTTDPAVQQLQTASAAVALRVAALNDLVASLQVQLTAALQAQPAQQWINANPLVYIAAQACTPPACKVVQIAWTGVGCDRPARWIAAHGYSLGDYVTDVSGNVFRVQSIAQVGAGQLPGSGLTEPTWSPTIPVADGALTWAFFMGAGQPWTCYLP